jgi:hypothetical protein
VDHPTAPDQVICFDPSLLPTVESRRLAWGAAYAGHLLHNQNVARITFDRNRVLLKGFAPHLTAHLDIGSAARAPVSRRRAKVKAVVVRMPVRDPILNLP